jgi:hypothetical protein
MLKNEDNGTPVFQASTTWMSAVAIAKQEERLRSMVRKQQSADRLVNQFKE